MRYPGTFAQLKAFSDLGLFELAPVRVNGSEVVPRQVFHALAEPKLRMDNAHDVCIIGVRALGKKNGQPTEATVEVIDYYDEATGFTAMQRTTGWHLSIVAAMMARGETPIGSIPLELAVPGKAFVREAKKRGFSISENVKTLQTSRDALPTREQHSERWWKVGKCSWRHMDLQAESPREGG